MKELILLKYPNYPKKSTDSMESLWKLPATSHKIEQILKFVQNHKRSPNIGQSNFEKEEQSWRHHISQFQAILQNYTILNSMVLAWNRHMYQRYRIETPEVNPTDTGNECVTKVWSIYSGKRTVSSTNGVGKPGKPKAMHETGLLSYTRHKNQSK